MAAPLRITQAVLVIVDISGYTEFIHKPTVSLAHAEAIITDLIETVVAGASFPLKVNKLEGDAALLFAEYEGDPAPALRSVLAQTAGLFALFRGRLAEMEDKPSDCSCDACTHLDHLRLKALVHLGEIAVKRVLQFEEIAGAPVILIHRLLKNQVPSHEYLLLSEDCLAALDARPEGWHTLTHAMPERPGLQVHWCSAEAAEAYAAGLGQAVRVARVAPAHTEAPPPDRRESRFRNLPAIHATGLWARLQRLFRRQTSVQD